MSLDVFNVVRPNQKNQAGDPLALATEEFSGTVEGTIKRRSALKGFLNVTSVRGTTNVSKRSIGSSPMQVVQAGVTPDGVPADFSKISVLVDTHIYQRHIVPDLDTFQLDFNYRRDIGLEQGKAHAKFLDNAMFIQAIKAARLTTSPYGSTGHLGGSQVTLATANATDPAAVYDAVSRLFAAMEAKDVSPSEDDVILAVRPSVFYTLANAEQIINGEYVTADGTKLTGMKILSMFGVPVISTNNLPNGVVTGHPLSNSRNSNAYDGDFSNVLAVAFSPKALLVGETIPLTTEAWRDPNSKSHYVDSSTAYAATPDRPEYAGVIQLV